MIDAGTEVFEAGAKNAPAANAGEMAPMANARKAAVISFFILLSMLAG